MDGLIPGVQDQLGQHDETPSLQKIQKISQVWLHVPVVPAIWEDPLSPGGCGCSDCDHATALHPEQQSETLSQKEKRKEKKIV